MRISILESMAWIACSLPGLLGSVFGNQLDRLDHGVMIRGGGKSQFNDAVHGMHVPEFARISVEGSDFFAHLKILNDLAAIDEHRRRPRNRVPFSFAFNP